MSLHRCFDFVEESIRGIKSIWRDRFYSSSYSIMLSVNPVESALSIPPSFHSFRPAHFKLFSPYCDHNGTTPRDHGTC
ncbi:uncharacterized protein ARMOST_18450 [Armillaria ostoyae]|uniref:Uncharacterized protein n=1 Tax=Armillaria ostoyae TaxID=47428 RepID=A0A284S1T4_ARMOS|nr:uncharacterized protein ARMOST_18450 [Armillaria ostoyae]